MDLENCISKILEINTIKVPQEYNEEYVDFITTNDILILDNIKQLEKYTLIKDPKKRTFSSISLKINQENNKVLKLPNKPNNTKIPIYELNRFKNRSLKDLIEERDKLKDSLKEITNQKDPKIEGRTDYYTLKKEKWIKISQEAVYELLKMFPETSNYQRNSIKNIMERFKINKELIKYDEEYEDFI